MATHLIKKQVLDLKISNKLDAFRVQQSASIFYYQTLLPVLEQLFDELSTEEETIQLDKLDIDLGVLLEGQVGKSALNKDIYELLKAQIKKQLLNSLVSHQVSRLPNRDNAAGQWLFYMEHGYLHWNTLAPDEKWYQQVLEALATDFALTAQLRKLITTERNVVKRIVAEHPVSFRVNLIQLLTAKKLLAIEEMINQLSLILVNAETAIKKQTGNAKEINSRIWETAIRIAAEEQVKNQTEETFLEKIINENIASVTTGSTTDTDVTGGIHITDPILKKILAKKRVNPKKEESEKKEAIQKITEKTIQHNTKESASIDPDGIFVQQAGLVLVHPFLSEFFRRLDLIEQAQFKNTYTQQKAICLLYYMASGNQEGPDHQLVIPKIICNYPPEIVVDMGIQLSREELEEADNLLKVIIEKWEKLKSTSVRALQENFLQRRGKLFTKNDTLIIQVETGTLDVLLDYLPWNLSIIKLPWRKELIRVEWR